MKKVIVVILALALALSLAACGKENSEETTASEATEVSATEAENETEAVTDDAETTEGEDEAEFPFLTYDEFIEALGDWATDPVRAAMLYALYMTDDFASTWYESHVWYLPLSALEVPHALPKKLGDELGSGGSKDVKRQ